MFSREESGVRERRLACGRRGTGFGKHISNASFHHLFTGVALYTNGRRFMIVAHVPHSVMIQWAAMPLCRSMVTGTAIDSGSRIP